MKNRDKYCSESECHESQECHRNRNYENCEDHSQSFLELADCAWMEVLKEKIKEHIKQEDGQRLDELARIVSEANKKRWEHKMCKDKCCEDFEEQLCMFFGNKK